jgi:hypothetical protein
MANEYLKKYFRMTKEVRNIFEDLEDYLAFCKKQGYVYDENHLYNEKTPWGEFQRVLNGKHPKDNWSPYPKEKREFRPRDTNSNWKVREQR